MDIKQIRYFVLVYDSGSLSAAAKEEGKTVQAVSKAIADLEKELGGGLFIRENRGMRPTPLGRLFYRHASSVLGKFDGLILFARRYRIYDDADEKLRLALNTPPFAGNELVRKNVALVIAHQLVIEAVVDLAVAQEGLAGLREGRFDALITVGRIECLDVTCLSIGTVPPGVMMRTGHPLSGKDAVSLSEVAPYPVARASWFDDANESVVDVCRKRAPGLRYVDVPFSDVPRHFDEDGVLLTVGVAAMGRMTPECVLRPLAEKDSAPVPLCIVFLKSRNGEMLPLARRLAVNETPSF